MAKTKDDLTLGEAKTKADLTLESKNAGLKWNQATWTWETANSTWGAPKISGSLESKSKVDLTLE